MSGSTAARPSLVELSGDFDALSALHQSDLFTRPAAEVEAFRLHLLRERFDALRDRVAALGKLSDIQGVSAISSLNDAAPLLFQHTVYKSYPMSFLERGRFAALTKWLNQLTVHDLSGVDAGQCELIEDWLRTLDKLTPLRCNHTTGTTGKLSFLPRTAREWRLQNRMLLSGFQGMPGENDLRFNLDEPGFRLPIIQPSYRHGFYMAHRNMEEQIRLLGDPDKVECLYGDELLSPDVLSLAGRVAAADAKGGHGGDGQFEGVVHADGEKHPFARSEASRRQPAGHLVRPAVPVGEGQGPGSGGVGGAVRDEPSLELQCVRQPANRDLMLHGVP